jgi:RNA polymerase sigma factor (sigma-70 family)
VILMPIRHFGAVSREGVRHLFQFGAMGAWPDGQLVALFVSDREGGEAAFRVLLHRHGPMVMGVCHRVLGDAHAAEDAFQATFLVLVRKAGTLRDRDLLANWLYGVAHRVARKAKAAASRRRDVERDAAGQRTAAGGDPDQAELRAVIDEEIRRLPDRYREPLVLCYLEGLHHHEVARRLNCPVGTVESRLSRARERLRSRLARRGLAPTSAVLVALLAPESDSAALPPPFEAALRAAVRLRAGQGGAGVAAALASATQGLRRGPWTRAGVRVATLLACTGAVAAGFGPFQAAVTPAPRPPAPPPVQSPRETRAEAPPPPADSPSPVVQDKAEEVGPRETPLAVAHPLARITVDGRLDDWPKDLPRYRIGNRLVSASNYDRGKKGTDLDPDAYFSVGYDPAAGLIYIAVVVRDEDLVVNPSDPWHTDAVEVYVDGARSGRVIPEPSGDWRTHLDASTMPVLQYAAVPGPVPAFGDPRGANPSLVYGRVEDTATKMRSRREGDVTTYEWAVQAFDRYPDRPTRLAAGKRLGFDVAVVDKDPGRPAPAWFCWGPLPRVFKGVDPRTLGELELDGP